MIAMLALLALATASPASFVEQPFTATIPSGKISGTLELPNGSGPFPVVLIIAGSGPTDRDGNALPAMDSDAYRKLAAGLAAQGVASLRYDKRGIGASVVNMSESDLRFNDYVDDALVLTAQLERDKRFSSVSIIGHSEGSLIGMLAAQRDPHLHAFISLEGAGRNLATIINEQIRAESGNPPSIVAEVVSYNASLVAGKIVPSPDPMLAALFRPSVQPYLISEYKYDPAKEIAKLTIPVLIVHGSHDIQVSDTDAKLLAAADPHAALAVLDGMNHILVDAPADRDGNIKTYSEPARPLNERLVTSIIEILRPAP